MIVTWFYKYFLYILLALATAFGYFWISQNKQKLRIGEGVALLVAVLHTLLGLACVKVFAFLEGSPGGMSLFGGILFMPVLYFGAARLFKRGMADIFDVGAMLMIFTLLCARLNCFHGGCCLGACIPGSETLRWPTRELEVVFYIILLVWLGKKAGKAKHSGTLYPLFMLSYGSFRFVEEWFRETANPVGFFHISHIWALASVIIGACVYYRLRKVNPNGTKRRGNGKTTRRTKEEKK